MLDIDNPEDHAKHVKWVEYLNSRFLSAYETFPEQVAAAAAAQERGEESPWGNLPMILLGSLGVADYDPEVLVRSFSASHQAALETIAEILRTQKQ